MASTSDYRRWLKDAVAQYNNPKLPAAQKAVWKSKIDSYSSALKVPSPIQGATTTASTGTGSTPAQTNNQGSTTTTTTKQPTPDEMLRYLHGKDKNTLTKRYKSTAEILADYNKAKGITTTPATGGPATTPPVFNHNPDTWMGQLPQPTTQPTTPAPTEPTPTTPDPTGPDSPVVKTLYPNPTGIKSTDFAVDYSKFNPNNYLQDYRTNPLYQWQLSEGQKALDRKLSANGLTNSGAELESNSRLSSDLGSQYANKAWDDAMTQSQRAIGLAENEAAAARNQAQANSSTLFNQQENEANRLQNGQQNAFGNQLGLLQLLMGSGNSLMNNAYSGANSGADLTNTTGANVGKLQTGMYNQTPFVGSGGGGSPQMPFIPAYPSGPNNSSINMAGALGGGATNNNYWDIFKNFGANLGNMFGGGK